MLDGYDYFRLTRPSRYLHNHPHLNASAMAEQISKTRSSRSTVRLELVILSELPRRPLGLLEVHIFSMPMNRTHVFSCSV